MPLAKKYIPHYTVQDYMRWEGDWELIEGIPVAMTPSAGFTHQRICSLIHYELMEALKDCKNCLALYELDWIVSEDTVLRPDIMVICSEPDGEYITTAPEVIFEVVSRQTLQKDQTVKYEIYEKEGVRYYVIVYPERTSATVYKNMNNKFTKLTEARGDKIRFELGDCAFLFDFSVIFKQ